MRRPGSLLIFLVLVVMAAGYALPAPAADRSRQVLLILDASGSMWGQIGGKAKIGIAKEVMSEIIQDLPSDLQVALMVYGHRHKGDCTDVEVMVPFGPLDRNQLIARVHALRPKGMTPIAHSISLAAAEVRKTGQGGTIILVSDGEETCDGDPCKLVGDLRAAGLDVIMHVVGFGVQGVAADQLSCIATAGGGTYAEASDAGKLKTALVGALEKTLAENLVVRAVQVSKAKGARPAPLDALVRVSQNGVQIAESRGTRAGFKLDPGTYDLGVTIPALQQTQSLLQIAVAAQKKTELEVPFTVAALGVRALDSRQSPRDVQVRIFPAGQNTAVAEGWSGVEQPRLFALPAGSYRIDVTEPGTQQTQVLENVVLPEGQEVIRDVSFALARLGVRGRDSTDRRINVFVRVFKSGETERPVIADWCNAGDESFFELPPRLYDITVEEPDTHQSLEFRGISLDAGASVIQDASFAQARIGIRGRDSTGQRINVFVKLFKPGDSQNPVIADWSNAGDEGFFEVPPGTYDLTVEEPGAGLVQHFPGTALEAGAEVIKEVAFAKARLGIRGKDSTGRDINVNVKVYLRGETGRPLASDWSNAGREHFFELAPGSYDVTVEETRTGQSTSLQDVVLEPGATVIREVVFAMARLGVRGHDAAGKEVNVNVKIFRQGETGRPVASDWSNAGRESFFDLPPGTYDLQVEDSKLQQKTELPGVILEPGSQVVKEVTF